MPDIVKMVAGPNTYDFASLYFEEADELIVGVDSGLAYLVEAGVAIDIAIGDFDSLDPDLKDEVFRLSDETITLPAEKKMTDLAFAFDYVHNHIDYRHIMVYGGIGGRVDHFVANMNLLKRYQCSFRDDRHHITVLRKGTHHIENFHHYVSFFALEDCYGLSLKGFRYPLNDYYLNTSDSLCVSNEGSGTVSFEKGRLMVIMSNDR
jgi:thiamine pyrophosphokinase